jgi:hypothetical protein
VQLPSSPLSCTVWGARQTYVFARAWCASGEGLEWWTLLLADHAHPFPPLPPLPFPPPTPPPPPAAAQAS